MNTFKRMTHLGYIEAVREIALPRLSEEEQAKLLAIKLVYGAGHESGLRGITFFERWRKQCHGDKCEHDVGTMPLVEVCALGEESIWQLAGTTLHELAHVLAGPGHGHDKAWKAACERLGLRRVLAAGTQYRPAMFESKIREQIARLPLPADGMPNKTLSSTRTTGGCMIGIGTRGGKSRGKGSGSRLVKCECEKCGYIARVTRKWIEEAGAPICPTDKVSLRGPDDEND